MMMMMLPASQDCGDDMTCANGYQCYAPQKECDEKADCLDQSDEWNCICKSLLSFYYIFVSRFVKDSWTLDVACCV